MGALRKLKRGVQRQRRPACQHKASVPVPGTNWESKDKDERVLSRPGVCPHCGLKGTLRRMRAAPAETAAAKADADA